MIRGIPVFVSTGDSGSSDVFAEDVHGSALTEIAAVSYPASSAYALACGGTTLHRDANNQITSEVTWNDLQDLQGTEDFAAGHNARGGATGGGVSALFPVPSYQRAAGIAPQTVNTAAPADRQVMRGIPDIAGNADKHTGYVVASESSDSGLENYGGTSAVAPLWAALVTRLNEHLGGERVGRLHGLLYQNQGQGCRDITEGDNNTSPPVGGYPAAPGWDASTGWGSPDCEALLALLKAQQSPSS
ncbi:MAG: kumamolisin [Myxococcota bacterium]|jgi:kumamolisin